MSLDALERKVEGIECRVRVVEVNEAKSSERMDALMKRLDNLSKWIMALIITLIPCVLMGVGFLVIEYVKGG